MKRKAVAFLLFALLVSVQAGAVVGILRGIAKPANALIDQLSRPLIDQNGKTLVD